MYIYSHFRQKLAKILIENNTPLKNFKNKMLTYTELQIYN